MSFLQFNNTIIKVNHYMGSGINVENWPTLFLCWKFTPFCVTFERVRQFSTIGGCHLSTNFQFNNDRITILIYYFRLFEKSPDLQDLFVPFRGMNLDQLRHDEKLREHGLRVMGTIEKCVARLDSPKRMETMLSELGHKHVVLNIKPEYFEVSHSNWWSEAFMHVDK